MVCSQYRQSEQGLSAGKQRKVKEKPMQCWIKYSDLLETFSGLEYELHNSRPCENVFFEHAVCRKHIRIKMSLFKLQLHHKWGVIFHLYFRWPTPSRECSNGERKGRHTFRRITTTWRTRAVHRGTKHTGLLLFCPFQVSFINFLLLVFRFLVGNDSEGDSNFLSMFNGENDIFLWKRE